MNHLFQALTNTADGAFVVDENQDIVYWNQAAQEILGYTSDEVVGQPCYELLRGCSDKGQAFCCHQCGVTHAVFSGKAVTNYDLAARTKSGEMRWINISILTTPPTEANGSKTMIVHLIRDVTQIKLNEQFIHQMFDAPEPWPKSVAPAHPQASSESHSESHIEKLTNREGEVLALLMQGHNTQDIAQSLSISYITVRNHIQRILHKLHVHSRLEAVAYAFEHNLIDNIKNGHKA